jgi:hypothetical protein
MKKKDFLGFLLFPVYLTIGMTRHEGSHAFAAMPEGLPEFTEMYPQRAPRLVDELKKGRRKTLRYRKRLKV